MNRYVAPSISLLISSPDNRGSCWDGSAANASPSSRHSSVCTTMASGSLAPMMTSSGLPTEFTTSASLMLRASDMAPG
ncbi:Uncharacterised protein [Mycobacterium tuberculosis]|nr:Uncharacterised protein [Mycobacterium tuberculosis]